MRNLFIVWLLTGIWHGASWNFVVWGLLYFILLFLEKYTPLGNIQSLKIGSVYTLLAVGICWVFFRAPTLTEAVLYLETMFCLSPASLWNAEATVALTNGAIYFLLGIVLSTPIFPWLTKRSWSKKPCIKYLAAGFQLVVFLLTIGFILSSDYDPFIYFNF